MYTADIFLSHGAVGRGVLASSWVGAQPSYCRQSERVFPARRLLRPSAWPVRHLLTFRPYTRSTQSFDSVQISCKSPAALSSAGRPAPSCGDARAFEQQRGHGKFGLLKQPSHNLADGWKVSAILQTETCICQNPWTDSITIY